MLKKEKPEEAELVVVHEFRVPRKMVFTAFSTAKAMAQWWGPIESKNSVLSFDFRPGGLFHYKMEFKEMISYGRFVFGKIEPYHLLEFTVSFSDQHGNSIPAPFSIDIPTEIFYRLQFEDTGNRKSTITMLGYGRNATEMQRVSLRSIGKNVSSGFKASFEKLEQYLEGTNSVG